MISPWTIFTRKNIKVFKAQEKPTMHHTIIDLHVIHVVKTSKTKTLLTGVESDDFIDS
jgi:hypothetical protein